MIERLDSEPFEALRPSLEENMENLRSLAAVRQKLGCLQFLEKLYSYFTRAYEILGVHNGEFLEDSDRVRYEKFMEEILTVMYRCLVIFQIMDSTRILQCLNYETRQNFDRAMNLYVDVCSLVRRIEIRAKIELVHEFKNLSDIDIEAEILALERRKCFSDLVYPHNPARDNRFLSTLNAVPSLRELSFSIDLNYVVQDCKRMGWHTLGHWPMSKHLLSPELRESRALQAIIGN